MHSSRALKARGHHNYRIQYRRAGLQKVGTIGTGGTGKQSDLRGRSVSTYSYTFLRGNFRFILVVVRGGKMYFAALPKGHPINNWTIWYDSPLDPRSCGRLWRKGTILNDERRKCEGITDLPLDKTYIIVRNKLVTEKPVVVTRQVHHRVSFLHHPLRWGTSCPE